MTLVYPGVGFAPPGGPELLVILLLFVLVLVVPIVFIVLVLRYLFDRGDDRWGGSEEGGNDEHDEMQRRVEALEREVEELRESRWEDGE